MDITQFKLTAPDTCGGGCTVTVQPGDCGSGCLTSWSGEGYFAIGLKPTLIGTFGAYTNVSVQPTITLVFNDPTGAMSLENLPNNVPELRAIQFGALDLTSTSFTETLTPAVAEFQLGLTNADVSPWGCDTGCKYNFTFGGRIQGVPLTSPLAELNGYYYSAAGDFSPGGTLNFGQFRMDPDPGSCGGGCINADLPPGS